MMGCSSDFQGKHLGQTSIRLGLLELRTLWCQQSRRIEYYIVFLFPSAEQRVIVYSKDGCRESESCRNKTCCCIGTTIRIIIAILILILIVVLTVFKPKRPVISYDNMSIKDLDFSFNLTKFKVYLNVTLDVNLSVKDPNKAIVSSTPTPSLSSITEASSSAKPPFEPIKLTKSLNRVNRIYQSLCRSSVYQPHKISQSPPKLGLSYSPRDHAQKWTQVIVIQTERKLSVYGFTFYLHLHLSHILKYFIKKKKDTSFFDNFFNF